MLLKHYTNENPVFSNCLHLPSLIPSFPIRIHWFQCARPTAEKNAFAEGNPPDFEAHFVLHGHCCYVDGDNRQFPLVEGEGIILFAKKPWTLLQTDGDCVHFSLAFSAEPSSALYRALADRTVTFPLPSALTDAMDTILYQFSHPTDFTSAILSGRLTEIFAAIIDACRIESRDLTALPPATDARVIKACAYVRDNLQLFLSCKEVASHCNLSSKQMERIFRESTGEKLLCYIHRVKTQAITDRLICTNDTLQKISDDLGFSDVHYFHRFFTRQVGLSPSAYRKKVRQEQKR